MRRLDNDTFRFSHETERWLQNASPEDKLKVANFWSKVLKSHARLTGVEVNLLFRGDILFRFNPVIELTEDMQAQNQDIEDAEIIIEVDDDAA